MSVLCDAIRSVDNSKDAFCKFLSANDTGRTGGHQCGILISISAKKMIFDEMEMKQHIAKRTVKVTWQNDITIDNTFTYYESKKELRITCFGKKFEYLDEKETGSLFILARESEDTYFAYILSESDDIDDFLSEYNLSPSETNKLINKPELCDEDSLIASYVKEMQGSFPSTKEMSSIAREICKKIYPNIDCKKKPDSTLLLWINEEYKLYRAAENVIFGSLIIDGFNDLEEFMTLAKTITNTRKSRGGKSLENHLCQLFRCNELQYSDQAITEGRKTPDFIFPSIKHYHDMEYPVERIVSLAAKTTCKDRWRQILTEADRLKERPKYLCTLQQGLSMNQLEEMNSENVILVVPKEYIKTYPKDSPCSIISVEQFITRVREIESL